MEMGDGWGRRGVGERMEDWEWLITYYSRIIELVLLILVSECGFGRRILEFGLEFVGFDDTDFELFNGTCAIFIL